MTESHDADMRELLRSGLDKIRELSAERDALRARTHEPVAVVGTGMRLPGAEGLSQLRDLLTNNRSGIGRYPAARVDDVPGGFGDEVPEGGFLDSVDTFDADFFGVSPREAISMDPQQRILLEVMWNALADAGARPASLKGERVGVFVGVTNDDYMQAMLEEVDPAALEAYAVTGGASTFAAGRLSYWLGIHGPSLSLDTACSSSLVALHVGVRALRGGEADLVVAGGVNVLLSPRWYSVLGKAGMLSPDSRCHTFDSRANGYVRSEGCGAVVLKRLSDAVRDEDRVLAVISGSAVNHDGRASGITVPNGRAQRAVIREALTDAAVSPHDVGYVEAHGTGTPLGDPIEISALSDVYCEDRTRNDPLRVGSVKANLGHLEPAAGITGLLSAIAVLQGDAVPPVHGLHEINPEIDPDRLGVEIPRDAVPWEGGDAPRVAGVSSFGASGTNAHVVLRDPPPSALVDDGRGSMPVALTLSARTAGALSEQADSLADVLERDDATPKQVAHTLARRSDHWPVRSTVVLSAAAGATAAAATLRAHALEPVSQSERSEQPSLAWLFTGQGSQYDLMGRQLFDVAPVFHDSLEHCAGLLQEHVDVPLTGLLWGEHADRLHETHYTQPAVVAVQWALAEQWRAWGCVPDVVIGHSIGELTAAAVSGIISIDSALSIAAVRGRLMQTSTPQGAVIAVFGGESDVAELLVDDSELVIAAVNAPRQVTVSGTPEAVGRFRVRLDELGIHYKELPSTRAFHSPFMASMQEEFAAALASVKFSTPRTNMISCLTGDVIGDGEWDADYLVRHAREPVDFLSASRRLLRTGRNWCAVEIGPGRGLTGMVRQTAREPGEGSLACAVPSVRHDRDEPTTLVSAAATLWESGITVEAEALAPRTRPVSPPAYPFQRKRFWYSRRSRSADVAHDRPALTNTTVTNTAPSPQPLGLIGQRIPAAGGATYLADLDERTDPCLLDCVIGSEPIVNVGFFLESALEAAAASGGEPRALRDVIVRERLPFRPGHTVRAATTVNPTDSGAFDFTFESAPGDTAAAWTVHARGTIVSQAATAGSVSIESELWHVMSGAEFYRHMWRRSLYLGDGARWVEGVRFGEREAEARLRAPDSFEAGRYRLPPGLVDAVFQVLFAPLSLSEEKQRYMVVAIDEFVLGSGLLDDGLMVRARLQPEGDRFIQAHLVLADGRGIPVVRIHNATLARAEGSTAEPTGATAGQQVWAAPVSAGVGTQQESRASEPVAVGHSDVLDSVVGALATALHCDADALELDRSFQSLGLDSLMALEVRDSLRSSLGASISLGDLLEAGSARRLAEQLLPGDADAAEPAMNHAVADGDSAAPADTSAEPFPLTDLQQAYLVGRDPQMEIGGVPTFFSIAVQVRGLDRRRFENVLNDVIAAHDMLRAVITQEGQQCVLPEVPRYVVGHEDLSDLDAEAADAAATERARLRAEAVSDAEEWPLFTITTCAMPDGSTRIDAGLDALIIDAWSTSLLFNELATRYHGETPVVPGYSFRDYVVAELDSRGGEHYREASRYWEARLATLPSAPDLPTAADPATVGAPDFKHLTATIDAGSWAAFKERAGHHGVTPSAALAAAYGEAIAHWATSPVFTLTLLFFNRRPVHPDVNRVLGNFSTTTLLEVDAGGAAPFADRAAAVQRQLWDDLEHASVSGVEVLRKLAHTGGARAGRMPVVFASTINFDSADGPAGLAAPLIEMTGHGEEISSHITTPQVWLDHQVVEDEEGARLNWDFVGQILPTDMVGEMFRAYTGIVEQLATDPAAWTQPVRIELSDSQVAARNRANNTGDPFEPELLQDRLLAAAEQWPESPAVLTDRDTLTFGELTERANGIAAALTETAGLQELVGVWLPKGTDQIAATLGVLVAGKAYVPFAWDLPMERLRAIVDQADLAAIITSGDHIADAAEAFDGAVLDVCQVEPAATPPVVAERVPHDLAYVIFTSGSTGTPKGVMIEHCAARCTIRDINRRYAIGPGDRVFGISALNFDLSVWDVFGVLGAGGAVVLPGEDDRFEPARWLELCRQHDVTVWNSVPALAQMVAEELDHSDDRLDAIRVVMMSGDWISLDLPPLLRRRFPAAELHSLGGATEAAIWSISHPIGEIDPSSTSVPYGTPLTNQTFHVLDDRLRDRPVGVIGDLYIGGAGLARGYLGDPERTAASFIDSGRGRLYRTGDLGRYLPDGTIEFLGRVDGQVKIQGHRIELGEVETVLARQPEVTAAVAAVTGERTGPRALIAGVVAEDIDVAAVRNRAEEHLPHYMVPTVIDLLDEVPLTANGKVDRDAVVVRIGAAKPDTAGRTPRNETEEALARLWNQVLGATEPGIDSDFFEAGGNSLLGMRLMSRIRQERGISLPVASLFAHPTIARLAPYLERGSQQRDLAVDLVTGDGVPSFWFHPVGGDVMCYRPVAGKLDGRPVVGVQAPDSVTQASLDELADDYAEVVQARLADGEPAQLAGWSLGGVLALEVGRRLHARGRQVMPILAVDLMEHPAARSEVPDDETRLARFVRDVTRIADVETPEHAPRSVSALPEVLRAAAAVSHDVGDEEIHTVFGRFAQLSTLLAAHSFRPVDLDVDLVRASHGASEEVATEWARQLPSSHIATVDGDHYTVMQQAGASRLAALALERWSSAR